LASMRLATFVFLWPPSPRRAADHERHKSQRRKGRGVYRNKENPRQWLARSSGFNSPQHLGPLSGQPKLPTNYDLGQGRFAMGDQPRPLIPMAVGGFIGSATFTRPTSGGRQKHFAPRNWSLS